MNPIKIRVFTAAFFNAINSPLPAGLPEFADIQFTEGDLVKDLIDAEADVAGTTAEIIPPPSTGAGVNAPLPADAPVDPKSYNVLKDFDAYKAGDVISGDAMSQFTVEGIQSLVDDGSIAAVEATI